MVGLPLLVLKTSSVYSQGLAARQVLWLSLRLQVFHFQVTMTKTSA